MVSGVVSRVSEWGWLPAPAAASLGVVAVTSGSNCCTGQKTNGIVGNETKQGGYRLKLYRGPLLVPYYSMTWQQILKIEYLTPVD